MGWLTDGYTAWMDAGTTELAPPVAGIQDKPGTRFFPPRGFWASRDGAYSIMGLHGDQPITQPCTIKLWWNGTPPPMIGFDVNFAFQGQVWNIPIRHTLLANDTQINALKDMLDQFQNHPKVIELFGAYADGPDILSYAYVRREPAQGEPHRINIFGHYQMIQDTNITVVAAAGVMVEGVAGNNRLSSLAEIAPFFAFTRSFDGPFIEGSLVGGITWGYDLPANPETGTPARKADGRNADPMPATIMVGIREPVNGVTEMMFTADFFTFQDKVGNRVTYKVVNGALVPA